MIPIIPNPSNSSLRKTACGGVISSWKANFSAEYRGETVYFCRLACVLAFQAEPDRFICGEIEHPQEES